jgi:3-keto-5-aminohexanoate cleavage enzyme
MGDKAVITCALNGVLTDPKQHHVPVTPEQMAREAKAAFDAGASVMHIHLRRQAPNQGHLPSWEVEVSREIQAAIRAGLPRCHHQSHHGHAGPELSGRAGLRARDPTRNGGLQRRLAELSEGEGRQQLGLAADDVR